MLAMPSRFALALIPLLLLAGCAANSGVIYYRDYDSTSLGQAAQHLRGSEVTLVVLGNPFGGDQVAFEQFVADTIHGANPGTAASFNPAPADVAMGQRRIILVFNGPIASNGWLMCGDLPQPGGGFQEGGHIRTLAAFCGSDDRSLSYLSAGLSGNQGPDDPKFRNYLRQIILSLLPLHDPDDRPDRDNEPPQPQTVSKQLGIVSESTG
jgi:hypothetical protein